MKTEDRRQNPECGDGEGENCRWWELAAARLLFACIGWRWRVATVLVVALLLGALAVFGQSDMLTIKKFDFPEPRVFVRFETTNTTPYTVMVSSNLTNWNHLAVLREGLPSITLELRADQAQRFFKVEPVYFFTGSVPALTFTTERR